MSTKEFRFFGWALAIWMTMGAAGRAEMDAPPPWERPPLNWFSPSVHLTLAAGDTSANPPESLAVGHHDPTREQGTVQGLELGMSMRAGEHLEGFATYTLSYGAEKKWDRGWEEAFLKLARLPGGFEARGGRMLSRFGIQNAVHLHGWNFVDMPLALGRFLGDDGLIVDGADLAWIREIDTLTLLAVGGYGKAKNHSHDHGEHEDDHAGDVHDEGTFADRVGTGRLDARWVPNDFNRYAWGISAASGENGYDKNTTVLGLDFSYRWRENGYAPGGRAFVWNTEALHRWVNTSGHDHDEAAHAAHDHAALGHQHEEHDHEHESHAEETGGVRAREWGLYTEGIFSFSSHLDAGLRFGYVQGSGDLGAPQRFRISPALTWFLNEARNVSARLQYNYDDLKDKEEHSVWAQVGFSWGGAEVR